MTTLGKILAHIQCGTFVHLCLNAGSSAKKHGEAELCSILNKAIREDDPNTTVHAVVFAHAINMQLLKQDPWLVKTFQKSFPLVHRVWLVTGKD